MSLLDIDKIKNNIFAFSEPVQITENSYIKNIELKKLAWLNTYKNDLYASLNDEFDNEIKKETIHLAQTLFPNGVNILDNKSLDVMVSDTKELISSGASYIYGATFYFNGILVVIDILKVEKRKICIYKISNQLEIDDMDIESISLQYYVLKALGYNVKSSNIIHINGKYMRSNSLELDKLFCIKNVIDEVKTLQKTIPKNILEFKDLSNDNTERVFLKNGQNNIPEKSIFSLFKLGSQKQVQLYSKGIINIDQIPSDFSLTNTQQKIVQVYKTNQTFTDASKIKEFVNTIKYPIYHLSINTYTSMIPEFEDVIPYQKIPFQYSLDIEQEDGSLEHRECICDNFTDPRFEFTKQLCEDIPHDSTILVYDKDLIDGVIRTLASPYNGKSSHLMNMSKNIKDLMLPFKKNHYISPLQNVSYDFKSVCTALVPDLSDEDNKKLLGSDCEFNTLASVKILEILKKI